MILRGPFVCASFHERSDLEDSAAVVVIEEETVAEAVTAAFEGAVCLTNV